MKRKRRVITALKKHAGMEVIMKELEEITKDTENYQERLHFAVERIREIYAENTGEDATVKIHGKGFPDYFAKVSAFLLEVFDFYEKNQRGAFSQFSLEEWKSLNHSLYQDVIDNHYENSYANPDYSVKILGEEFGQILASLYTELRSNIVYAFENRLFYLTTTYELFIEIYNILEQPDASYEEVRSAIYYYFFDYADVTVEDNLHDTFDPARSFATDIICSSDFTDLRYLYRFGEYISENELEMAAYLNSLSEKEIHDMAFTFTDGYRRGFDLYRIDLSRKKTVNLRYRLGMERMIREVIRQLKELGLTPIIYRAGVSISRRNPRGKVGFHGASPNKQYEYDHRMDDAIFFDKAYAERKLALQKQTLESIKDLCRDFAGPAVVENFGETPFNPLDKENAYRYSEKQQRQKVEFQSANGLLLNEFVPGEQTSFSIIAYPLPEIGEHFPEIFHETIRVNTLNQQEYLEIQNHIIHALDQGEYVTITGRGENRTDLTVALTAIENPEKETKFENCLADVNIPLGEVFTTPRLKGTHGLLHVTKVYLNDLEYHDFSLTFTEGLVSDYHCSNFPTEEENKKYILENVLFHHKTLPMGEFAIGTNTTAYTMGKKYHTSHLLPILIAEKTGPHFAVGDTCFSHEEDLVTYNPDGKQMIAKENDFSRLRHTDSKKAYFNCHTDVTIPYDELGDIVVHTVTGEQIPIIQEGRFVLPGTEQLNQVL